MMSTYPTVDELEECRMPYAPITVAAFVLIGCIVLAGLLLGFKIGMEKYGQSIAQTERAVQSGHN